MPIDGFTVHNRSQLQLAVRMGGFLRQGYLLLIAPYRIGGMKTVMDAIREEMTHTDAGLQLYNWTLGCKQDPFGCCYELVTHFYDRGVDRLFARAYAYNAAKSLCRMGRPSVEAVARTVQATISYGNSGGNAHCVSASLMRHCGVCQAIALYMQQLLLRCGYAAVVRVGQINDVAHAWNEVCVDGVWQRIDLCVQPGAQPYVHYTDNVPMPAAEQYRQMTTGLDREIAVRPEGTTVNGMRLPFYLADTKSVCPTRFVQCFNGAYQRVGDHLMLALGNHMRTIPLGALERGRDRLPHMSLGAFADLLEIPFTGNRFLFQEGL